MKYLLVMTVMSTLLSLSALAAGPDEVGFAKSADAKIFSAAIGGSRGAAGISQSANVQKAVNNSGANAAALAAQNANGKRLNNGKAVSTSGADGAGQTNGLSANSLAAPPPTVRRHK